MPICVVGLSGDVFLAISPGRFLLGNIPNEDGGAV